MLDQRDGEIDITLGGDELTDEVAHTIDAFDLDFHLVLESETLWKGIGLLGIFVRWLGWALSARLSSWDMTK